MDDLNFNVDDIINDVNAKIKSAEKNENKYLNYNKI